MQSPEPSAFVLALDDALTAFSQIAPRQAKVVGFRPLDLLGAGGDQEEFESGTPRSHRRSVGRRATEKSSAKKLLHVTNPLYRQGISVQMPWTHCNRFNNLQCC
jgi:hypothetical protein